MMFYKGYCCVAAATTLLLAPTSVYGQSKDAKAGAADSTAAAVATAGQSPLVGTWSYRSFRSDPDLNTPANQLLFGSGTLVIESPSSDRVTGSLGGPGWSLNLTGGLTDGNPATVRFQGKGTIGGEEWIYDYLGYLVPVWPNGVDQRPAIVGTIVRTAAHSGGQATAGYVAQWIAVRQDDGETDAPTTAASD